MEWIATLFTAAALALNVKKNRLCWPSWIIGNILWIISMSWDQQWSVVAINIVFLGMNIWGWRQWSNARQQRHSNPS